MKFTIDNKELQTLLTDIQIKGKHLTSKGLKSSSLGTDVHISVYDNILTLWNADQTFVVGIQHAVEVDESDEGECVVDAENLISYLKKFSGAVTFEATDHLKLSQGTKRATAGLIVSHPNMASINIGRNALENVPYDSVLNEIYHMSERTKYEAAFQLNSDDVQNAIDGCEVVGSGVYDISFDGQTVSFSSTEGIKSYSQELTVIQSIGEPAGVAITGAFHKFLGKSNLCNFYMVDDRPIMIRTENRIMIKAHRS